MEPKSIVSANSTTGAYFAPGGRGNILSYRKNLVNSGHGMRPPQMGCGGRWERISSIRPSGLHLCLRILAGIVDMQQMMRFLGRDLLIERIQDRVGLRRFDERAAVRLIEALGARLLLRRQFALARPWTTPMRTVLSPTVSSAARMPSVPRRRNRRWPAAYFSIRSPSRAVPRPLPRRRSCRR